jgi:hypothetical protein
VVNVLAQVFDMNARRRALLLLLCAGPPKVPNAATEKASAACVAQLPFKQMHNTRVEVNRTVRPTPNFADAVDCHLLFCLLIFVQPW